MNNWAKIWNSKQANESLLDKDFETVFMELKRLTGNDTTGKGVSFEGFREQYCDIKRNLREYKRAEEQKSIFEVGCGSGPFLMMFQRDGYKVGGVDYSKVLIEVAKQVISNPIELYCGEATDINENIIYDSVISNSVFEYFESDEYAEYVMEKMVKKASYSVGILDVHDSEKQKDYLEYRRSIIENYDEKYKGLDKKFFNREFFARFAEQNNLEIVYRNTQIRGYWNNRFTFDVYMYKR